MAQAKKRQVRPARTSKSVPQKEEQVRPSAPAGTEEVGTETDELDEIEEVDESTSDDAQDSAEIDQDKGDEAKGETHDYIDAQGRVKAEDDAKKSAPAKTTNDTARNAKANGKGFSGGERYTPPTGKVAPPAGRIIPVGGELTFDGMDFGTHIVATEDVYQEVIPMGSRRRSYVLKIRKGATLPRTKYKNLAEG